MEGVKLEDVEKLLKPNADIVCRGCSGQLYHKAIGGIFGGFAYFCMNGECQWCMVLVVGGKPKNAA